MYAGLGGADAVPELSIREVQEGDEMILATDGMVDMFEDPATEETDMEALSRSAAQGATLPERLNHLRKEAKSRKTDYKDDDDIAIVAARII